MTSKRTQQRAAVIKAMDLALEHDDPEAIHQMLYALIQNAPDTDLAKVLRAAISIASDEGLAILKAASLDEIECTREWIAEKARIAETEDSNRRRVAAIIAGVTERDGAALEQWLRQGEDVAREIAEPRESA